MNRIRYERKKMVGKEKIPSEYYQLVEKCNNLHVSISCAVKLIDFN